MIEAVIDSRRQTTSPVGTIIGKDQAYTYLYDSLPLLSKVDSSSLKLLPSYTRADSTQTGSCATSWETKEKLSL